MKKIATALTQEKKRNASGKIKWDVSIISRVLANRLYSGYLTYNQSSTISPITHKRIKNTDRSTYEYLKSDKVPAIIEDDAWQQVQVKRQRRAFIDNRTGEKITPKIIAQDIWKSLMICECGKSFKRYKWRVNKTSNEECYGYQCSNVVMYHKKSYRESHGITENEGYCNQRSLPEWYLHFMFSTIMKKLWKSPARTVNRLQKMIDECYVSKPTDLPVVSKQSQEEKDLLLDKEHIEMRRNNLLEMRLEGSIAGEMYIKLKEQMDEQLHDIEKRLQCINEEKETLPELCPSKLVATVDTEEVKRILIETADLDAKSLDNVMIREFVDHIKVYENRTFDWYIDLTGSKEDFEEKNYVLYQEFKLNFDDALAYRKLFGNILRKTQWINITVNVFLSV